MAKEDVLTVDGVVVEVLPNATYRIELETKNIVLGYLGGRMRQNNIRVLLGDAVKIEMSPYDLTKGRIVYRK